MAYMYVKLNPNIQEISQTSKVNTHFIYIFVIHFLCSYLVVHTKGVNNF